MRAAFFLLLRGIGTILFVWTFGLLAGLLTYGLIATWQLKVRGLWRLIRPRREGVLVVSNHPSIWETIVLVGLFAPVYLLMPWRLPWSTPDAANFTDRWYWSWLRLRAVSMPRGNRRALLLATIHLRYLLEHGATAIMFPGGGREGRGKDLRSSASGRATIRRFRAAGISRLLEENESVIAIPVFVDRVWDLRPDIKGRPDFWRPMQIGVDDPVAFAPGTSGEAMARILEQHVLDTGEQLLSG